jgi:hypothetical protein
MYSRRVNLSMAARSTPVVGEKENFGDQGGVSGETMHAECSVVS